MGIQIKPYQQERLKPRDKKTTLYFVGWEYWKHHKGSPPPVATKQTAFEMPALGESMTLPYTFAKDLVFKTRFNGKPVLVSEEDGGKEMAALLKQAIAKKEDLSGLNLERLQVKQKATHLTDEDILELARQRNLSLVATSAAPELQELLEQEVPASDAPEQMGEVKRVGRPPAKKE